MLALAAFGAYRMWRSGEPDAATTDAHKPKRAARAKANRPQWVLTLADIDAMSQNRNPTSALIGARRWLAWLRRDSSVSKDDPRLVKLAQVIEKLERQLAPPITLEMIEKLLGSKDPAGALVQAQVWQEALRDQKVATGDPRLARLVKVIEAMTERLTPKPQPPPPYLADFQKLLQQIADKLKEENAAEESKALDRAEELLQQLDQLVKQAERLAQAHPDELAPYGRRLLTLKSGFAKQRAVRDGVRQNPPVVQESRRGVGGRESHRRSGIHAASQVLRRLAHAAECRREK